MQLIITNIKSLLARLIDKLGYKRNQTLPASASPTTPKAELADRLARLERNYLVLLKRVLEMDGIKVKFTNGKNKGFTQTVLATEDKGLNDNNKPTYH